MFNENWARWIYASVQAHFDESEYFVEWNKYLEDRATYDAAGIIPLYIDGKGYNPNGVKDYIEVRMDGPDFVEVSNNNYRVELLINVLLSITKDENLQKAYLLAGRAQKLFTTIPVYRFGCEDIDNSTSVGCLKIINKGKLETTNWGQPDAAIKQTQTTIESHYIMKLIGD